MLQRFTEYFCLSDLMERIFISIDIPLNDNIENLLHELRNVKNVRPVSKNQIHITLKFLGDTESSSIPKLCAELKTALSGTSSFELSMKGLGVFPNEHNPRVIWIGFEKSDEMVKLANDVENVLSSLKLNYDKKKFSPHVTVGRINGKSDITDILSNNREKEFCKFQCSSVNVMKSELLPTGAKHTVVESIRLL